MLHTGQASESSEDKAKSEASALPGSLTRAGARVELRPSIRVIRPTVRARPIGVRVIRAMGYAWH